MSFLLVKPKWSGPKDRMKHLWAAASSTNIRIFGTFSGKAPVNLHQLKYLQVPFNIAQEQQAEQLQLLLNKNHNIPFFPVTIHERRLFQEGCIQHAKVIYLFSPRSPIQDKAEFTHIQFISFQEATTWCNLKWVHCVECHSVKVGT